MSWCFITSGLWQIWWFITNRLNVSSWCSSMCQERTFIDHVNSMLTRSISLALMCRMQLLLMIFKLKILYLLNVMQRMCDSKDTGRWKAWIATFFISYYVLFSRGYMKQTVRHLMEYLCSKEITPALLQ